MESTSNINLRKMKFRNASVLDSPGVELTEQEFRDLQRDSFMFEITAEIYGRESESITIQYPADWWQWVKQRFFPHWALGKWPIRTVRHEITALQLFPDADITDTPALGPPQYVMRENMSTYESSERSETP